MNKFRKGKLASAMLCTLLFGGNAGAMQKDVSKGISSDKFKDNLLKDQTENKELENKKPGDFDNKLLEYILYVLVGVKLADEVVGVAEAKEYIEHRKLSPLGKLSIYKNLVARSYRAKTIETMRKLVGESNKNNEKIQNFSENVVESFKKYIDGNFIHNRKINKKEDDVFDIGLKFNSGIYDEGNLDIKYIFKDEGIPEFIEEYVKAVLGVSVEQCDKILVSTNKNNKYIAFVEGNVCLKLAYSKFEKRMHFILCDNLVGFDSGDYSLDLDYKGYCFEITLPYMERVLGVKHDENYLNKVTNKEGSDKLNYSFYGQIFRDLLNDWKGETPSGKEFMGQADKIFPDLFPKKEELIELREE